MIIVNADDWGRSAAETDAAARCHAAGRITSVSAMVFMEDSERAASLADRIGIDVGLHLNLTQAFSGPVRDTRLVESQARIRRFLALHKYAFLLYHPGLRREFGYVYKAQLAEFERLYGRAPTHIDGHHHKHLCTNLLLDPPIERGQKVRRNFHFWPGQKGPVNRAYRQLADGLLARRYRVTDFFFALSQCLRQEQLAKVARLAQTHSVELMAHPANQREGEFLMSPEFAATLDRLTPATYAAL